MSGEENKGRPNVWLGAMTFGQQLASDDEAREAMERYVRLLDEQAGVDAPRMIDSALMYPARESEGVTEQVLGRVRAANAPLLALPLATKANPWGDRTLSAAGVREQLAASLGHLGEDSVELFYLHAPDHNVPIAESLAAVDEAFRAGKFRRFGLSNYAAWQVAEIVGLCERHGWVRPDVYQGMYNAVTRQVEPELLPCLRHFGLAFYAYNVTAAGLLTGKHRADAPPPTDGRFAVARYQERFWKSSYHDAVELIRSACEAAGIPMVEAAHRWMAHHSALRAGDAIIVGASKLDYVDSNVKACFGEPLPQAVIDAYDQANELTKPTQPLYFR